MSSKSRKTSFEELAGEEINYTPRKRRPKEPISYDDPYFRLLDAGHDFLIAKKRSKEIVDNLPKELRQMISELEAIMKDMTMSAMEDDFDYGVQLNKVYFDMMRIERIASLLSFKMKQFYKNKGMVMEYLEGIGEGSYNNFVKELSKYTGMANELTLSSNIFMDHIEKEYVLQDDMLIKRSLAHEKTMTMCR